MRRTVVKHCPIFEAGSRPEVQVNQLLYCRPNTPRHWLSFVSSGFPGPSSSSKPGIKRNKEIHEMVNETGKARLKSLGNWEAGRRWRASAAAWTACKRSSSSASQSVGLPLRVHHFKRTCFFSSRWLPVPWFVGCRFLQVPLTVRTSRRLLSCSRRRRDGLPGSPLSASAGTMSWPGGAADSKMNSKDFFFSKKWNANVPKAEGYPRRLWLQPLVSGHLRAPTARQLLPWHPSKLTTFYFWHIRVCP